MLSTNIILYPEFNHCIPLPHHLTFIQATVICCFGLWLQPPCCWSCYTLVHPLSKSRDDTLKISHILLVNLSNPPVFSILGVKNQLLQVCSGPEQSHFHLWIHLYPLFLLLSQLQAILPPTPFFSNLPGMLLWICCSLCMKCWSHKYLHDLFHTLLKCHPIREAFPDTTNYTTPFFLALCFRSILPCFIFPITLTAM